MRRVAGCGVLAVAAALAVSCGGSPITSARIERAIAPTFANLVHVQIARVGLPDVAAADVKVTANCRKLVAGSGPTGAGDWVCTFGWSGPNGIALMDRYDVSVTTDGCYAATVDGAEAHLGGPTIRTRDGREVRNLLYTFEGCFDTM